MTPPNTNAAIPISVGYRKDEFGCINLCASIDESKPTHNGNESRKRYNRLFLDIRSILPLSKYGRDEAIALTWDGLDKARFSRVIIQCAAEFSHSSVHSTPPCGIFPAPDGIQ